MSSNDSEQLNAILDAVPGFVSWIDSDLNYHGVNSKLAGFFGAKPEDFIGKQLGTMTDEENQFLRGKAEELFGSKQEMIQTELKFYRDEKPFHSLLTLQKCNRGQNALLISIDITGLKMAEEQLKQEEVKGYHNSRLVALGEMAATITHEINNPLALISGSNSLLKNQIKAETPNKEILEKVFEKNKLSLKRIKAIINGVRNMARDGSADEFETVSVKSIFEDVTIFQTQKCKEHQIELTIQEVDDQLSTHGSLVQLGQVLIILINNSIDAIQNLDEKWVKVDASDSSDGILISVTDSGAGIPEAVADKVFSNFFTTKDLGKGTGIGLHHAKKIVESHNGAISIDQQAKNTKFDIIIPKN